MKERFEGEGRALLVGSIASQFDGVPTDVAQAIVESGALVEFAPGAALIEEGSDANHVFFIVAGSVSIVVRGRHIRTLKSGEHVGEMSAVEPALRRSASAIANDVVVAVRVSATSFIRIADAYPLTIWRPLAKELARRLFDRNKQIPVPNEKPRLFIMSSVEGLGVAQELQAGLQHDVLATVWTDGVFWAGGYPLETLEDAVAHSDFAVAVSLFEDTVTTSRGETKATIRDNVLFELGMFIGHLGRQRSILVFPKSQGTALPSDLHGITPATYLPGDDSTLRARLGPVCTEIRNVVRKFGVKS